MESTFKPGDYIVFRKDYQATPELSGRMARVESVDYRLGEHCYQLTDTSFLSSRFYEASFDITKSKNLNDFCDKIEIGDALVISNDAVNTSFKYNDKTLKKLRDYADNPVIVTHILNKRIFEVAGIDAFLTIDVFVPNVFIKPITVTDTTTIDKNCMEYCKDDVKIVSEQYTDTIKNTNTKEEKKMNKPKYKVGDLIRIRKNLKVGEYCNSAYVTDIMAKYAGQLAIITNVAETSPSNYYRIEIDDYGYCWTEEMFENTVEPIHHGIVTDNVGHAYKYDKNGIAHKYTKEEKKMIVNFRTVNGERYVSYGKHNGATIPQTTTEVTLPNGKKGYATVDTDNYVERDGILNAIANAIYGGNFDKVYDATKKAEDRAKAKIDKENRTCKYCGTIYDTVEEKEECVKAHIQRKKDKKEAYAIRKEARRRLEEAVREDRIEAVMQELLAEYETIEDEEVNIDTVEDVENNVENNVEDVENNVETESVEDVENSVENNEDNVNEGQ